MRIDEERNLFTSPTVASGNIVYIINFLGLNKNYHTSSVEFLVGIKYTCFHLKINNLMGCHFIFKNSTGYFLMVLAIFTFPSGKNTP